MLPPGESGRLVLLSDGQDTGDAGGSGVAGATALALARGVPIDTVPLAPLHLRDVAVRALSVPASVRQGDRAPLSITLYSSGAAHATLTLWIDGAPASQAIDLPAGTTILRTEEPLDTVGLHTFRVQLTMDGDAVPQNNTLDAATVVVPPGHVLFAVSDPTAATALAKALARAHLSVTPMLASDLPATTAGYRAYDGVVLDDVPATELSTAQQKALRDAVRADGLGLLAVGGSSSFGEGNYTHTPLEDALPVLSIASPRRVSAPLALMLVIDKSGSMSDLVAGVAKIDMVKVAAASALDRLAEGDAVGVLAFDDSNHWIVPFHTLQGAADKAHIRKQISQLTGDGDTYIYPALRAAESAVLSVPTIYRHVVLLTDGQGEDAPFDTLIKRMHREHITLSTEQKTRLGHLKQKATTDKATAQRKVDEAEQQLWELTAADQPDVTKIDAKVREIEKLRGDQRLAFIRSVGDAAQVLTDDQRKILLGQAKPAADQPHVHPKTP